uniref:Peroxisomal 2,4-dienoyl-CoA reductase n=1 Tax=Rhabditophanes sp. KR3021 TaxID=114890 RepID=A0AC35UI71_9BILA
MACPNPEQFFKIRDDVALKDGTYNGKVVLITGGGSGLGKQAAIKFSKLGGMVVIASRKLDILKKAAEEISQISGNKVLPIQMDVRDAKAVSAAVDEIEKVFGRLPDVCLNNSAANFISATERLSPNAINVIVEIVLIGTANVTLEIGRRIIKKKSQGCVFAFISTLYASSTAEFTVASGMAKSGIENLSRSLCSEWGKYGMRFNVIAPGGIPTEGAFGALSFLSMEDSIEVAKKKVPCGRLGTADELGNLITFICSDYCSWLNGSLITFDGGAHLFGNGGAIANGDLHRFDSDEWDTIEKVIRGRAHKNKL